MENKFLSTPILDTLNDYLSKDPVRMHVPFHAGVSNNNVFPKEIYNLDISEVSGYDIEGEDNPIFQSEKITADFFKVKHSFYLTGGASVGLVASLIALNKYGKKVLLARNVHKSVINGVILSGLEPVWLDVDFLDEWGVFSKINLQRLEKVLQEHSDLAGCVIVSPTYEGVISDVSETATLCHKKNIPLIVDEAHGAHLSFLPPATSHPALSGRGSLSKAERQPSAISLGADLIIQSWHKSLGSLTQTGVLHLTSDKYFSYYDLKRSLDLVSSTSPSFLLLLSLELTRKYLAETKGYIFNELLNKAKSLKLEMKEIANLELFDSDDPSKIYLKSKNISGIDFACSLYKNYSIEIESANDIGLLMLVSSNFNNEIKDKIICAIKELVACKDLPWQVSSETAMPRSVHAALVPREAFIAGFTDKNENEYYMDVYAPCPPGYVVSVPGSKKC